ncbi:hypothetical protein P8625_06475 [Tenacibaculum tangerinum]|uniref:Uncharacterized protein n=1 Tax=Tenacibaculum tangerinum TaxID=3038772 RepID=A0ABY8L8T0_9FLAO|nr:hypothetical protein [Tenacibaculum tangerinum]WGH76788.1 hypothetical protein P8625_06475 [Tenacibaculum tangerinum]
MAVWQYQLNIIPRKAILEKYGEIPKTLFIDFDGWEKYWENVDYNNGFPDPDFEDAKTIKWWANTLLDINDISKQIDKLVARAQWGNESSNSINWKGNSNNYEDNDCYISYNKTKKTINEFQFRVDLRKKENFSLFLKGILELCKKNELMVFNTNGALFEPKIEVIYEDLKKSNAVAFLTDPEKFLDKIAYRENIKIQKKVNLWTKIKTFLK